MTEVRLRLATREEVCQALGFALRFGRTGNAHRHASTEMARLAAEALVDHLELAGFVLMKRLPARDTAPLEPSGLDR